MAQTFGISQLLRRKTGRAEGPAKIAEGLQAASNLRKRAGEPERQLQNKRP